MPSDQKRLKPWAAAMLPLPVYTPSERELTSFGKNLYRCAYQMGQNLIRDFELAEHDADYVAQLVGSIITRRLISASMSPMLGDIPNLTKTSDRRIAALELITQTMQDKQVRGKYKAAQRIKKAAPPASDMLRGLLLMLDIERRENRRLIDSKPFFKKSYRETIVAGPIAELYQNLFDKPVKFSRSPKDNSVSGSFIKFAIVAEHETNPIDEKPLTPETIISAWKRKKQREKIAPEAHGAENE